MWNYEKRLQYPVKITQTNPKIAKIIISQFGGPDGELAASMRYPVPGQGLQPVQPAFQRTCLPEHCQKGNR